MVKHLSAGTTAVVNEHVVVGEAINVMMWQCGN